MDPSLSLEEEVDVEAFLFFQMVLEGSFPFLAGDFSVFRGFDITTFLLQSLICLRCVEVIVLLKNASLGGVGVRCPGRTWEASTSCIPVIVNDTYCI